jgi:hypothetical protein
MERGPGGEVLAVLAAALLFACSGRVVHTFGAERWNAAGYCLEKGAAVDVIEGADPGQCPSVRCWVGPDGEVWVTTTACDGPADFREGTKDPPGSACADAIAAEGRGAVCPEDGGLPPPDGGSDASVDAGVDAGGDAGAGRDGG